MTVKDYAALKTDITAALPDNTTGAIDPVDVRATGFIDTIDSLSLLEAGPITFATQQVGFIPPLAQVGSWRTVRNADFQGGLTMDGEDFVIFENCKFGGPVVLGTTTACDRVKFVECTSTGVTGTFLTATTCDRLTLEDVLITNATSEGIKLTTCTNVRMVDVFIINASNIAASITTTIVRSAIFESGSNLLVPNVVFAAVHLDNCTTVRMDSVQLEDCRRTGVYIKDSSEVTVRDIVTERGHLFVSVPGVDINDDPIVVFDSTNVVISSGKILNSGRHGIYATETPPAVPASGLGVLMHDILIEKVHIQHNPVDDRSDTTSSWGIVVRGGADITIQHCEIAFCGETGIEFGAEGSDRIRVLNNNSHGNGQNATLVHWDGFSGLSGCGWVIDGNTFKDNYRSGLQLKPGYLQTGGFHGEYPLADVFITKNVVVNNTRAAAGGAGINILADPGTRAASDRITISQNVVFDNDAGNFISTTGTGNIMLLDNHFGECAAADNVRWQDSHNVWVVGGYIHSKATAGTNFGLRATDNLGASGISQIVGVHFQGVDVPALNRRNTDLAVLNTVDPDNDTLIVALAAASTAEGRDIRIYDYLEGTTGGAADVRDVSEITSTDRADVAILVEGDAPVYCFANRSVLNNLTDMQTQDKFKIEPAQLLSSTNSVGTGPGWTGSDLIFVANGFDHIFGTSGDDSVDLNDVEQMMRRGWTSTNILPSTGDHPYVQAIADNDIEAVPVLVVAPT